MTNRALFADPDAFFEATTPTQTMTAPDPAIFRDPEAFFAQTEKYEPKSLWTRTVETAKQAGSDIMDAAGDLSFRDVAQTNLNLFTPGLRISEEVGPMEHLQSKAVQGLGSAITVPMRGISSMARFFAKDDPKAKGHFETAAKIVEDSLGSLKTNDKYKDNLVISKAPEVTGNLLGWLGTVLLTKGIGGSGTAAAGTLGAFSQAESARQEAENSGADTSTQQKVFYANLPIGATEAVPIDRAIGRIVGHKNLWRHMFMGGVENSIQGGFARGGENVVAGQTYDPQRPMMEGVPEAALVEGLAGTAFGGVTGIGAKARFDANVGSAVITHFDKLKGAKGDSRKAVADALGVKPTELPEPLKDSEVRKQAVQDAKDLDEILEEAVSRSSQETAANQAAKQPWEMTREEFYRNAVFRGVKEGTRDRPNLYWTDDPDVARIYGGGKDSEIRIGLKRDIPKDVLFDEYGNPLSADELFALSGTGTREVGLGEHFVKATGGIPVLARIPGLTPEEHVTKGVRLDIHKKLIEQSLREGKPVPRAVLENYAGESWADEALAKMESADTTLNDKQAKTPDEEILPETGAPDSFPAEGNGTIRKGFRRQRAVTEDGTAFHPFQGPEAVEFARDLMKALKGNLKLSKKIGNLYGVFSQQTEGVSISPRTAAVSENQAIGTILHEIGHAVDYLPGDMKGIFRFIEVDGKRQKINILAHLAGIKQHIGEFLGPRPGTQDTVITDADRIRMREEAKAQVEAENGFKADDGTEYTAKDILNIWKKATEADTSDPLWVYVAKLGREEKTAIVRQAVKGLVPDEIKRLKKSADSNKKITDAEIDKRAAELIRQEILKRDLFQKETIEQELKDLSRWWKPFDENADPDFTAYRFSAPELYADAFSALLNAPVEVQERAPEFFKGFFRYLSARPDAQASLQAINQINALPHSQKAQRREDAIKRGYAEAEEKIRKEAEADKAREMGVFQSLYRRFVGKEIPATRLLKSRKAKDAVLDAVDQVAYRENQVRLFLERVKPFWEVAKKHGVDDADIGVLMQMRSVLEARSDKYNPEGFTPTTAAEQIQFMRRKWNERSPGAYEEIIESIDRYYEAVYDIMMGGIKDGVFGKSLAEIFEKNKYSYATTTPVFYASEHAPASIKQVVGTLESIQNPFERTLSKAVAVQTWRTYNRARTQILETMAAEGQAKRLGKKIKDKERFEPKGFKNVTVMKNGAPVEYQVPSDVAAFLDNLGGDDVDAVMKAFKGAQGVFHDAFVGKNPLFAIRNIPRDALRTWRNLPTGDGTRLLTDPVIDAFRLLGNYFTSLNDARLYAKGQLTDISREMLAVNAFGAQWTALGSKQVNTAIDHLNALSGVKSREAARRGVVGKSLDALDWFRGRLDFVSRAIATTEAIGKIGAYKTLKQKGMSAREAAFWNRYFMGTPNYKRGGTSTPETNAILMYFNVAAQGLNSDLRLAANAKTAPGWWMKTAAANIAPKVVMAMAGWGLFSDLIKDMFDRISEYDKENYICIPLFIREDGKVVYLRIPQEETGRFISGVAYKAMASDKDFMNTMADAFGYASNQMPGVGPVVDLTVKSIQYAGGGRPRDSFRDKDIISRGAWEASQSGLPGAHWPARKEFAGYLAGQTGIVGDISNAIMALADGKANAKQKKGVLIDSRLERVLGFGVVLKASDYGLREKQYDEANEDNFARAYVREKYMPRNARSLRNEFYYLSRIGDKRTPEQNRRYAQVRKFNRIATAKMDIAYKNHEKKNMPAVHKVMADLERISEHFLDNE